MVKLREQIIPSPTDFSSGPAIDLTISPTLIDFNAAEAAMELRVEEIARGSAPELVWLLQHEALYTAGTSANSSDLLEPDRFPVHTTGRGGQYTYHGPGQRIAYVMLDLKRRTPDVRLFVAQLEEVLIRTLLEFGVIGERREDRVGVWVKRPDKGPSAEDKIAALGIRVRKWVTFHGLSINVSPNLEHFSGIVPCGVEKHGLTSLADLGKKASMADVDTVLVQAFEDVFGSQLVPTS